MITAHPPHRAPTPPFNWWMSQEPPFEVTDHQAMIVASCDTTQEAEQVCQILNFAAWAPKPDYGEMAHRMYHLGVQHGRERYEPRWLRRVRWHVATFRKQ